jgi:hypothetical protein
MFKWLKMKTLRDLNAEALAKTRQDLAYARLAFGRAKMEVELLEAREKVLMAQGANLPHDALPNLAHSHP